MFGLKGAPITNVCTRQSVGIMSQCTLLSRWFHTQKHCGLDLGRSLSYEMQLNLSHFSSRRAADGYEMLGSRPSSGCILELQLLSCRGAPSVVRIRRGPSPWHSSTWRASRSGWNSTSLQPASRWRPTPALWPTRRYAAVPSRFYTHTDHLKH